MSEINLPYDCLDIDDMQYGPRAVYMRVALAMAHHLIPEEKCYIIDVGCGVGLLSMFLWKDGSMEYLGYDIDPFKIDLARLLFKKQQFVNNTNFPENTPMKIYMFLEMLEHFEDPNGFIQKIVPAGEWILLSVPNLQTLHNQHKHIFATIKEVEDMFDKTIDIVDRREVDGACGWKYFLIAGKKRR